MKLRDILFVGGDVQNLASVKIRCREIADRLNCPAFYGAVRADDLPRRYKAYFCVKPNLNFQEIEKLSKHGKVIWDVLDNHPPQRGVHVYVASTAVASEVVAHLGRVCVIPHYHCNVERHQREEVTRRIAYVGSEHWYPKINDIEHDRYFVHGWSRTEVAAAYCKVGIAINLRHCGEVDKKFLTSPNDVKPNPDLHIRINSGVKLINCLGFGIPSVSGHEPAYKELAPDCTLFTDLQGCAEKLAALRKDDGLYEEMRARCVEQADRFHVDTVLRSYQRLLEEL